MSHRNLTIAVCSLSVLCQLPFTGRAEDDPGTATARSTTAARVTDDLIAFYPFTEGSGSTVYDRNEDSDPTDLALQGNFSWLGATNGISFSGGRAGSMGAADVIISTLKASSEVTFEAWIKPLNITQGGPTRIMSIALDAGSQDFVLGQEGANIQVRFRHSGKSGFNPQIFTSDGFLTTDLVHLVHIFDGSTELLFVNGVQHPDTVTQAGDLSIWKPSYFFSIGNEASNNRPFFGDIRLIAIYDRALSAAEIVQNYQASPDLPVGASAPPTVDAGHDQVTPQIPGGPNLSTTLSGTASDPDSAFTIEWTQVSGPQPATLGDPFSLQTTVNFPETGEYVFELSATDDGATRRDRMTVTVQPLDPGTQAQNAFPADQATGVSTSPTLEMTCATPTPLGGQFLVAEDPSFTTIVHDSGVSGIDVCSHVTLTPLQDLTEYYWTARQRDANGVWSDWSPTSRFTTGQQFVTLSFRDGDDGYSGTRDADIRGKYSDPLTATFEWNQGAQDVLRTGRRPFGSSKDEIFRSLLRFEITGVIDPDDIVSAYLELTGWMHVTDPVFHYSINQFYEVLTPWGEGAGVAGDPPANGEVSWTYAEFPIAWSIPGASDPGVDRAADPLMRSRLVSELRAKFYLSSEAFVELVRQWVEQPQTNHGLLFRAEDESLQETMNIGTREVTDGFFRPRLVIQTRSSPCSTNPDCADADFCNGAETCDLGTNTCVAGSDPCDDGVSCTVDACDEGADSCSNAPTDSICDDGDFCTGTETCDAANDCQAGAAPCLPGEVCDEPGDVCVECLSDGDCADADFCDGAETCDLGTNTCVAGSDPCDDGVSCTVDACDEGADSCSNAPTDSICDDGDFCTVDTCDLASGGCSNAPVADPDEFGDTILGSRYCSIDPLTSCITDADCEAGICQQARYYWQNSIATLFAIGDFRSSLDIGSYSASRFSGSLGMTTTYFDNDVPEAGAGFWYLAKPECPLNGSWQTVLGAEPARDQALP